ncbi:MAG: signal peptide peptidase SppA [Planctomycetes bacterium]|nr:signal peptide peptidase SppA [Planctomycetota bacterium]
MSSAPPPPGSVPPPTPPPGVYGDAGRPAWQPAAAAQGGAARDGRGVSFFVAVLLGLLLLVSGGLNVLLFVASFGSMLGSGLGDFDAPLDETFVAGQRSARAKVLQVGLRGAIAEGQSAVLGGQGGSVSQVKRALRQAAGDDVRGLLLHIDSPGGGVTDSDEIHALLLQFRREHPQKPVLALFGDLAASGGYYVAMAAERVLARSTTITGSIGVIMSSWNFAELAKRYGVEQVAIKSERTPWKDMLSPTRPMRDEERAMLTSIVDELYDRFVTVVDAGRPNLDRAQVQALATGAIYSAQQALQNGLVDGIGDHDTAAQWFAERLGGPVQIVERRHRPGLSELLFGARTVAPSAEAAWARLLTASSGPRFLYFWEGGR